LLVFSGQHYDQSPRGDAPQSQACPWRIRKLRRDRHLEQTTAMVPPAWSRSPGMGGRDQSERLVAINWNRWSQSAGTRPGFRAVGLLVGLLLDATAVGGHYLAASIEDWPKNPRALVDCVGPGHFSGRSALRSHLNAKPRRKPDYQNDLAAGFLPASTANIVGDGRTDTEPSMKAGLDENNQRKHQR
jgi:hypothetical protein